MIKVMLADDHSIIREGLRRILDSDSMRIVGMAEDGVEALTMAKILRPDVVVLDVSMPRMDGFDCARELIKLLPDTKILVLTMHDNVHYAIRVLETGAHGFLTKGAASAELIEAIKTVMKGKYYISPNIADKLIDRIYHKTEGMEKLEGLSPREFQVLRHMGSGHTLKETSEAMAISEKTVSTYRSRIREKLNLKSASDLIRFAIEHELLE